MKHKSSYRMLEVPARPARTSSSLSPERTWKLRRRQQQVVRTSPGITTTKATAPSTLEKESGRTNNVMQGNRPYQPLSVVASKKEATVDNKKLQAPSLSNSKKVLPREHVRRIQSVYGAQCDIYRDIFQLKGPAVEDSSPQQIRAAYFRRGRQILRREQKEGNDRQAVSEQKQQFQALSLAYEIMSHKEYKQAYDLYGWEAVEEPMEDAGLSTRNNIMSSPTTITSEDSTAPMNSKTKTTSVLRNNSKRKQTADKKIATATAAEEGTPRSNGRGISWSEHVEELVYKQHPEEEQLRKQKRNNKKKIMLDHQSLSTALHELEKEHRKEVDNSQVAHRDFFDNLEDKMENMSWDKISFDSLLQMASSTTSASSVSKQNHNDQDHSGLNETKDISEHIVTSQVVGASESPDQVFTADPSPNEKPSTGIYSELRRKKRSVKLVNPNGDLSSENTEEKRSPVVNLESDAQKEKAQTARGLANVSPPQLPHAESDEDLFHGIEEKQSDDDSKINNFEADFNPFQLDSKVTKTFSFKERKKAKDSFFRAGMSARKKPATTGQLMYSATSISKIEQTVPKQKPLSSPVDPKSANLMRNNVILPVSPVSNASQSTTSQNFDDESTTPSFPAIVESEDESKESDFHDTGFRPVAVSRGRSGISAVTDPSISELHRTMDSTLTSAPGSVVTHEDEDFIGHLTTYFHHLWEGFGEQCGKNMNFLLPDESMTDMLDTLHGEIDRSASLVSIDRANTF